MPSILIVAPDTPSAVPLQRLLEGEDFSVAVVVGEDEAVRRMKAAAPELVLLDSLSDLQANIDICYRLRIDITLRMLPIVIISSLGEETDRVAGLDAGADDYVVAPYSGRELVARIYSSLRRANASKIVVRPLTLGTLILDRDARRVTRAGNDIRLRPVEFAILEYLMTRPGRTITRTQFKEGIWGSANTITDQAVDVHIKRLRQAVAVEGEADLIITIRHLGYRIEAA